MHEDLEGGVSFEPGNKILLTRSRNSQEDLSSGSFNHADPEGPPDKLPLRGSGGGGRLEQPSVSQALEAGGGVLLGADARAVDGAETGRLAAR